MSLDSAFRQLREANPVPDPASLTDASEGFAELLTATRQRSTEVQTQEPTKPRTKTSPSRRPWLIPAAGAAALVVIAALIVITNVNDPAEVVDQQPAPTTPTTIAAPREAVDISVGEPIQVLNDQGARATISFSGDARSLVEGGVHMFGIQMEIEEDFNQPAVSVSLVSNNGEIATTGVTADGDTFTPTWSWTPDGDKVVFTMVGRGVAIPDTRPTVVVTIQETAESSPVEFVLAVPSS